MSEGDSNLHSSFQNHRSGRSERGLRYALPSGILISIPKPVRNEVGLHPSKNILEVGIGFIEIIDVLTKVRR